MNADPEVSVLMAVYNGARYVCAAIDSILKQTLADFEFIVIDDGSTDSTLSIVQQAAQGDSRLRVISRPNQGLTATLNEGLELARGEFLARIDADDIALPGRLEDQLQFLRGHPEVVLVGSRVLLMDPDGLPIREMCTERTHQEIDQAHLHGGWPVVHPAVMMRTASVKALGGYRTQYDALEDFDLFLRLAETGALANLPQVLLHYRQHLGSVTHRKTQRQSELRKAILQETYQRRGLPEQPGPTAETQPKRPYQQHRFWAWAALKSGYVATGASTHWPRCGKRRGRWIRGACWLAPFEGDKCRACCISAAELLGQAEPDISCARICFSVRWLKSPICTWRSLTPTFSGSRRFAAASRRCRCHREASRRKLDSFWVI